MRIYVLIYLFPFRYSFFGVVNERKRNESKNLRCEAISPLRCDLGIDENHDKVKGVLTLVQGLSNKHNKPLSVRFLSDGKAKIEQKTNFNNQYLKDVIVRSL